MYILKEADRDYKAEYARYQSSPKAKADRAARNKARKHYIAQGLVEVGDDLEIDHIAPLALGGTYDLGNTRVVPSHDNRVKGKRNNNDDDLMNEEA